MQRNGPIALMFHTLVVSFVLAPLVVICLVAFTPENTLSMPWNGFSLRWFEAIFAHPDFVASFRNSLWLATLSATPQYIIITPSAAITGPATIAFDGAAAIDLLSNVGAALAADELLARPTLLSVTSTDARIITPW